MKTTSIGTDTMLCVDNPRMGFDIKYVDGSFVWFLPNRSGGSGGTCKSLREALAAIVDEITSEGPAQKPPIVCSSFYEQCILVEFEGGQCEIYMYDERAEQVMKRYTLAANGEMI